MDIIVRLLRGLGGGNSWKSNAIMLPVMNGKQQTIGRQKEKKLQVHFGQLVPDVVVNVVLIW